MADLPKLSPATTTVTVGCKLPNGIHMDFHTPGKPLRRFTLRGSNASRVVGGFGITHDVPKDFFDEWMKVNAELPAVKNGFIFAMKDKESVESRAKEMAKEKTGLERLDPKQTPKGIKVLSDKEVQEEEV